MEHSDPDLEHEIPASVFDEDEGDSESLSPEDARFEVSPPQIEAGEYLDLSHLVHRLRRLVLERSKIPRHSGKATSGVRRKNRLRRKNLTKEIEQTERQIIEWAMMVVPVEESDLPKEGT